MKISVVSRLLEHQTPEEAIDISAKIGYSGIEFFGIPEHLPASTPLDKVRDIATRARDRGVNVTVLGTYVGYFSQLGDKDCEKQLEDFKRYVEMAHLFACPMVRVWTGGPLPQAAREDHWLRAAHYVRECADIGLREGLVIMIETIQVLPVTIAAVQKLLRLIDRPNVGIVYDPGGMFNYDPDYGIPAVRRLGRHIQDVHLKDRNKEGVQFMGEGLLDYRALIRALREEGYDGYYAVECHKEHSIATVEREYRAACELLKAAGVA